MSVKKALVSFLVFLIGHSVFALEMPSEWMFGTRSDDAPFDHSFTMKNTAREGVIISTLVSCECLAVTPSSFNLAPGESRQVRVTFSPQGIRGSVKNAILVKVKGGETLDRVLTVQGTITAKETASSNEECLICREREEDFQKAVSVPLSPARVGVLYYYSGDCASCTRFISSEIPRLQKALGKRIVMDLRDIRTEGNMDEIVETLAKRGTPLAAFPIIVVNETVLMGEKQIREQFEGVLRRVKAGTPGK